MEYVRAFLLGGLLCALGQILIDRTALTPAKILTGYVTAGVLLSAFGLYQPLADWGGAGATVPLTGFGHLLARGVRKAVAEQGLLGALTGGVTAAAGGITAAIFFGFVVAADIRPYTRPSTSNVGADLCVRSRWPPHPRWSPSSVMASPCHLPPGSGKAKKRTKRLLLWCQGSSLVLILVHAEHGPGLVKQVHHAAVVQNGILVQPVLLPVAQLLLGQERPVL